MTVVSASAIERRLAVHGEGRFSEAEVRDCDEPVRRYFCRAIAPGTPLAQAVRLRMRGSIKIGKPWLPFRSNELLAPLHGYSWPATVAGGLLRGSDTYADGQAAMTWRLLGVLRVIHTSGPNVARSAMGRAVAESVWLPTALLPRYGVRWRAEDDHHLIAVVSIEDSMTSLHITIDDAGLVTTVHIDRWNDPEGTGRFDWCPFGIEVRGSRSFPCGITMPAEGTGGWFHGTDRWDEGAFMRYTIVEMALV
jgi:hypothetical protein